MYPITKSVTQYGFRALNGDSTNTETEEYVYADDPKDGNDSSAEEKSESSTKILPKRMAQSAGPAMAYIRAHAQRLNRERKGHNSECSEEEEDTDCSFSVPWRLIPESIMEELEFYKNADNALRDQIQRTTQLVFVEKEGKGMVPKLKDPINLFPKELGPQQAARWPAEIQVIEKRIKHIPYVPSEPEPFYKNTGSERTPMVHGEDRGGRLIFMYEPRSTFFVRSRVGGIPAGPEQCNISVNRAADDATLVFESRFESGNLAKAVQVADFEYELWLRYDLYTSKHTQWFYYSVSNTRPNQQYRFTIVNFMKPDSLYNYGMKPLQYSEKDALKKIGWRRYGSNIKYYRNNTKYETSKGEKPFYSLTWTTEFNHKHDTVYFAHCFPYTYTDLQDYLLDLQNDPIKSKICKQRVLCRTLAGNLVYLLTITSPSTNPEDIKHKKAVVLTARVHPGESNSSWMMKGFLDYLTSNTADSKLLRDTFIFKIVPMLNPDGVIVGNYRCSLAGRDLNRNYKTVLKDAYPTVWHTKQMIRRLLQEREIVAYCDLHGHSRRHNVFIYGCENRHMPDKRLRERIFPCMLNKNSPDKFAFDSCKFKVQKSKEGTGRIVMWNMGILNSYTMEATFCGSTMGKKKGYHFSTRDFEEMGVDFCDTLLDYCDPDTTKCANVLCDLEENLRQEIRIKLVQKGVNPDTVDLNDDLSAYEFESSDCGSDSSDSDGPPVHLQFQTTREDKGTSMEGCMVPKKKKKLRSRKERDKVKDSSKDSSKKGDKEKEKLLEDSKLTKPLSGHQAAHAKQEKLIQNDPRKLLETAKCDAEDTQAIANTYLESLTEAYIRKGIIQKQHEQAARRLQGKAPAHLRYSGTVGKPPPAQGAMPISFEGLCPHHEQAFAAQLMAQQLQNMTGVVGNSFVRVWKEYLRKHHAPPKLQQLQMDELMRQQGASSPSQGMGVQTERRHSRHLLEVSEDRKRQELLQQHQQQQRRPEKSASKTAAEDKEKLGGLSTRLKAQIPSATFVHYDTFKISQMNIDTNDSRPEEFSRSEELNGKDYFYQVRLQNLHWQDIVEEASKKESQGHHKGHKHSGRKSRMGMHDSEEEDDVKVRDGPDYVQDPHAHRPPRVKSARHRSDETNSAIQFVNDLRQSLASSAANTHLSPTAGNYIKKLLNEDLKQTTDEVDHITAELQNSIHEKEKQYGELIHQREIKKESEQKVVEKSKQDKKELPKPERKDSVNTQKSTKSLNNLNGNAVNDGVALNSKLVDTYHIPDSNHTQGHGFKGGKLIDTDNSMAKHLSKLSKGELNNSTSGLHYSSATDLTQPQFYATDVVNVGKLKKKAQQVPRSSSSSSSREEGERRSVSTTLEKYDHGLDRETHESTPRVKSAKNSSRQVVETIPTRISLMITHDHDDSRYTGAQFKTRYIRGPFNKSATMASKRK
ncbi:cytosolic carboxypeptidase 2-like isoform X3 [Dreissena polymorpha]|uniref:cytosolic carboxypeptidase 2-like isoform X3 n=1 Tax=Dreissena polymorpha TaxID=45954 RepID=UPI002264256A|nr:cytosolic carboxypeptidase 2-like isoform X3 [Dreissena polymorpha]